MPDILATYTLATARTQVRDAVEFVSSGSYSDGQLDYAIKAAVREFVDRVRPDMDVNTSVSTVANQKYIDLPATIAPRQVVRIEIVDDAAAFAYSDVHLVDYDSVKDIHNIYGGSPWRTRLGMHYFPTVSSSIPRTGTIDREGRVWLDPTPDAVKTVRIHYWTMPDFTGTLNVPDSMMDGVLYFGVPKYLGATLGDAGVQQRATELFERHIAMCRGRVGIGPHYSL